MGYDTPFLPPYSLGMAQLLQKQSWLHLPALLSATGFARNSVTALGICLHPPLGNPCTVTVSQLPYAGYPGKFLQR